MKKKNVVVVGGGTGTFTVLKGLKEYPDLHLSAVISMTDSGGSNRVLRDEFGMLPSSDLIQCIVALASKRANGILRELFSYRYSQGTGISGMRFGNLFMAALTDIYGSQRKAVAAICKLLDIQGEVLPVTYDNTNLVARYENGVQVLGEHYIDEPEARLGKLKIVELSVFPEARVNPDVVRAFKSADLIVFGPGDLFTSVICNLVISGVPEAIHQSKAKKVMVMNLMTKLGETYHFGAKEHLAALSKYLGKAKVDCVLMNHAGSIPKDVLTRYEEEMAEPVKDNLKTVKGVEVVRGDFVGDEVHSKHKSDKLKRSLIRHDSAKLAKAIYGLLE